MRTLLPLVDRLAPRILTQISRDPNSATYGSFDRNWWHYKIRDFSSIILQQGGYFLWLLGQTESWRAQAAELNRLARASCLFWNERAACRGAFEEYYPWEKGYPPVAFSTLAVAKLAHAGVIEPNLISRGAAVATRQLLRRFEHQAANQQIAGLAALAWTRRIFPDLVPSSAFAELKTRALSLQTSEGWFEEYGGPDLGYLSVTLDCLWDLADATGDDDFLAAARRALDFIEPFVALTGASIGLHNARNTDYIVPYGIARFAADGDAAAASILAALYQNADHPSHFIHATDDRYLCHYIGHSILRAALLQNDLPALPLAPASGAFEQSGHLLFADPIRALISTRKGGIVTAWGERACVSDYGWVVLANGRQFVNHWWSDEWTSSRDGHVVTVRGKLVPHREHLSSPLKHALLRAASYTLGQRLIRSLKSKLIFQKHTSPYTFERQIYLEKNNLRIVDHITGLPAQAEVRPAPRSSKRHVASADSFHPEDLRLDNAAQSRATQRLNGGEFFAEATHLLP